MIIVSDAFKSRVAVLMICSAATPGIACAQEANELAKQLSNPIADLTSVPLQLNYDEGFGEDGNGYRSTLNIQPVVPIAIDDRWNMISRTILPLIAQDDVRSGAGSQSGVGDILQSVFFSPKAPTDSGWTWGAGPALLMRTASETALGTDKWSAGPTVVALKQTAAGWTYGALANHLWSFAGNDAAVDVNSTFLQPFIAKGLGQGRTVSVNFESTYDWQQSQWNVPFNIGYSKVTRLGSQLISYQSGVRYFLETPNGGPEWGVRFTLTLLFPKG
jgi:hypothetical protein